MHGIDPSITPVIQAWALSWPSVSRVWIFGSRARADHRPDSDLDIAVEVTPSAGDESSDATWMMDSGPHVARLKAALSHLPYEIDVENVNFEADQVVGPSVKEHGIQLYERGDSG
jgi:predicted nucleotidyltransferase